MAQFVTLLILLCSIPSALSYKRATEPRLDNLNGTDVTYAKLYWKNKIRKRVVNDGEESADRIRLGYRFIVPLPERLAGLTYVGHAARLRLLLERARNGEALRVAALGGSITTGQGAGGPYVTYAAQFAEWLNAALPPHAKATSLTAATSGSAESEAGPQREAAAAEAAAGAALEAQDATPASPPAVAQAQRRLAGVPRLRGPVGWLLGGAAQTGQRPAREQAGAVARDVAAHVGGMGPHTGTRTGSSSSSSSSSGTLSGAEGLSRARRLSTDDEADPAATEAGGKAPHSQRSATAVDLHHEYICGAVPGTQSGYMSSCMQHHLPPGVDLVLLEYAVNDNPAPSTAFTDPNRRAFERLIRKVLGLPSRPAVVLVNMFAHEAARGRYWYNAERDFHELASYYGLPSVSLKAAVLPAAATAASAVPALSLGAIFNGGKHHPGRGGHVVAAELLITLATELLSSNARLAVSGDGAGTGQELALLQLPYRRQDSEGGGDGSAGLSADVAAALAAVASRPLPPPLAEGNYEVTNTTCYIEHELQTIVQQPVDGWTWTDEGRNKWGWVALEAKQQLRMQLSTQLPGKRSERAEHAPVVVQIAYLQSYSGMGTAQLTCEDGCTCEPSNIDAQDERRVSVTSMRDVQVSQHATCVLALTTTGPSPASLAAAEREGGEGGGSKFKLIGVVVGEEPGASEGDVSWLRVESHEMSHRVWTMHRKSPAGSSHPLPGPA